MLLKYTKRGAYYQKDIRFKELDSHLEIALVSQITLLSFLANPLTLLLSLQRRYVDPLFYYFKNLLLINLEFVLPRDSYYC